MAALRSAGRKLSFDVLATTSAAFLDDIANNHHDIYRSNSVPPLPENDDVSSKFPNPNRRKRKNKSSKKKKKKNEPIVCEESIDLVRNDVDLNCTNYSVASVVVCDEVTVPVPPVEEESSSSSSVIFTVRPELRQRNVVLNGGGDELAENAIEEGVSRSSSVTELESSVGRQQRGQMNGGEVVRKLEKEESLDWNRVMAEELTGASPGATLDPPPGAHEQQKVLSDTKVISSHLL